jgi:3-deoxy-D-manno-octulosonic-acid transferase
MILIYNIAILIYKTGIHIASFFNEKARLWVNGRKDILKKIENQITNKHPISQIPNHHSPITNPKSLTTKKLWLHVSSLGEFEQGRPIIEALKKDTPHNESFGQLEIIMTFFSPSGYEIRKNYPLADHIFYLPMDTADNAKRFINWVKPDIAIFVKYDFWYHYLNELNKNNIPILLISSIFTHSQFSYLNPYSFFLKKCLQKFTHIFAQNTPSVELLKMQGFHNITLAGDTRIDRVAAIAQEAQSLPDIEKFIGEAPSLICGSTWQPDEELIMEAINHPEFKDWKFIFAPHDISKHNIQRLENQLAKCVRYSQIQNIKSDINVLIIDNIGMLSALYRYGHIAYIGGGFGKGIHNTLEPIAFGLPVIFGPRYEKFEEAVQLVKTGGGFSVKSKDDFLKILIQLKNTNSFKKSSNAAKEYIKKNQGATGLILDFIKKTYD